LPNADWAAEAEAAVVTGYHPPPSHPQPLPFFQTHQRVCQAAEKQPLSPWSPVVLVLAPARRAGGGGGRESGGGMDGGVVSGVERREVEAATKWSPPQPQPASDPAPVLLVAVATKKARANTLW